jgi:hypothetical protein
MALNLSCLWVDSLYNVTLQIKLVSPSLESGLEFWFALVSSTLLCQFWVKHSWGLSYSLSCSAAISRSPSMLLYNSRQSEERVGHSSWSHHGSVSPKSTWELTIVRWVTWAEHSSSAGTCNPKIKNDFILSY